MKFSKALSERRGRVPHFPVIPPQGGDTVAFAEGQSASLAEADSLFPEGLPSFVKVNWATYRPGGGWEFGLGAWRAQIPMGWHWPQKLYLTKLPS